MTINISASEQISKPVSKETQIPLPSFLTRHRLFEKIAASYPAEQTRGRKSVLILGLDIRNEDSWTQLVANIERRLLPPPD
jgi:hypothetical protein